jgi:hypothetical protein
VAHKTVSLRSGLSGNVPRRGRLGDHAAHSEKASPRPDFRREEIGRQELESLLLDPETPARADAASRRGLFLGEATAPFVDAVWRLMRLLDAPELPTRTPPTPPALAPCWA